MIALASDCLLVQLAGGERLPLSAEMISFELEGQAAQWVDKDLVRNAAKAVFHYFRQDLGRETITLSEFARALQKVLRGFKAPPASGQAAAPGVVEADLRRLAQESAEGLELFFFARLRQELRRQMRAAPRLLRFRGLRPCVMQLAAARRWTARCRNLEEQVVAFLRGCLAAEGSPAAVAMVVE